jgi:mono/diheme cytochrome c family protein
LIRVKLLMRASRNVSVEVIMRILLTIVAIAAANPALAAGNSEAGRLLIERSCTGCHAGPNSAAATDAAPSFLAIARRNRENRTWVRAWLTGPHPAMPGIDLSRRQIDDITAYLNSLPTK